MAVAYERLHVSTATDVSDSEAMPERVRVNMSAVHAGHLTRLFDGLIRIPRCDVKPAARGEYRLGLHGLQQEIDPLLLLAIWLILSGLAGIIALPFAACADGGSRVDLRGS